LAFSYWFDKPRFLTEGKLAAVLIIPSLGVPNWSVIYINTAPQSSNFQEKSRKILQKCYFTSRPTEPEYETEMGQEGTTPPGGAG
jgi:hypothetical protein